MTQGQLDNPLTPISILFKTSGCLPFPVSVVIDRQFGSLWSADHHIILQDP